MVTDAPSVTKFPGLHGADVRKRNAYASAPLETRRGRMESAMLAREISG
jgi:hypothetical protein